MNIINNIVVTLLTLMWTLAATILKLPFALLGLLVKTLWTNAYFVYAGVVAGLAYNIVHAGGLL